MNSMPGLTDQEIARVVYRYIGVSGGYLGNYSGPALAQFYPLYCDLDINPYDFKNMTNRERFIEILKSQTPIDQAKILRGVLDKSAIGEADAPQTRTQELYVEIGRLTERLEQNAPVANITPLIASQIVTQAIADAEVLLQTNGAASAVDRVHTAMHGYLRTVCEQSGITFDPEDTTTRLLRLLRQQHPAFQTPGVRNQDLEKIPNALGAILDSLNALRNHASLAHPNHTLLNQEEAMLVINVTRTIFHYLDAKFSDL